MKYFIYLVFFILVSCSPKEWNGKVRYEVTGTASDVAIIYNTDSNSEIITSTALPWSSSNIEVDAGEDSSFNGYIKAIYNSSSSTTLDVYIYIDDELKAHETGTGTNFEVSAAYTVDHDY